MWLMHICRHNGLFVISGTNPTRISEIYEKLVTNIETLETMGKEEKNLKGMFNLL